MNRFLGFAVAVTGLSCAGLAGAQEPPALYQALEFSGNFSPDPITVDVEAGGDNNASTLNDQCVGAISSCLLYTSPSPRD